jgi:hypothetical protein
MPSNVEHGDAAEQVGVEGDGEGVDGHGLERLEHLDEGDGEVGARRVGEPERTRARTDHADDADQRRR